MINTSLFIDFRGQLYDIVAQGKVQVEDFRAEIVFPAPYAIYAFEAHGRNIRDYILSFDDAIHRNFVQEYRRTLSVREALIYARAELLDLARKNILRAPAPPPPKKNPFRNRLRRITGRLADTARTPRLGATPTAIPGTEQVFERGTARTRHRFATQQGIARSPRGREFGIPRRGRRR